MAGTPYTGCALSIAASFRFPNTIRPSPSLLAGVPQTFWAGFGYQGNRIMHPSSTSYTPIDRLLPQINPSRATVHRWSTVGVVARDGERVKLRTTKIGGRVFVTDEDLAEFVRRTNQGPSN